MNFVRETSGIRIDSSIEIITVENKIVIGTSLQHSPKVKHHVRVLGRSSSEEACSGQSQQFTPDNFAMCLGWDGKMQSILANGSFNHQGAIMTTPAEVAHIIINNSFLHKL